MLETLRQLEFEVERFKKTATGWHVNVVIRVMIGWMGVERARAMNDFVETTMENKDG